MPMPEIGRFLGMVVTMYFQDHPPPHFHVRYGDHRAIVAINTLEILAGTLPPLSLSLILNASGARGGKVVPIEPL